VLLSWQEASVFLFESPVAAGARGQWSLLALPFAATESIGSAGSPAEDGLGSIGSAAKRWNARRTLGMVNLWVHRTLGIADLNHIPCLCS
jgi:hypothetical protein